MFFDPKSLHISIPFQHPKEQLLFQLSSISILTVVYFHPVSGAELRKTGWKFNFSSILPLFSSEKRTKSAFFTCFFHVPAPITGWFLNWSKMSVFFRVSGSSMFLNVFRQKSWTLVTKNDDFCSFLVIKLIEIVCFFLTFVLKSTILF